MKNLNLIKTYIFLIVLFTWSSLIQAQETFYKTYDGSGNDIGSFVTNTTDGGYVIIGKTNSFGAGGYDAWLIKTNSEGDTLWTHTYGKENDDDGRCVCQTSDGGYIVVGNTYVTGKYNDGWIFKTDGNGVLEWEHTFGGELNMDGGSSLIKVGDEEYIVTGRLDGKSYIFKTNEEGEIIWEKTYFENNYSDAGVLCPIANNNYAVVGSFQLNSGGSWYPDLLIITSTGELITQLTWTQFEGGVFQFVTESSNGGMLIGGSWNGTPAMMRLGPTGMEQWQYFLPSAGNLYEYFLDAVLTANGNFVVVGNWNSAAMLEINDSGDTLWTKQGGKINNEFAFFSNLIQSDDKGFVITGYGKTNLSDHQVFLTKTTEKGFMQGIEQNFTGTKQLKLLQNNPNPFSDQTTIKINSLNNQKAKLFITDNTGRRIKILFSGILKAGLNRFTWDGSDQQGNRCSNGIYFLTLRSSKGKPETIKMVKTGL
jgi:hypothetical protein